MVIDLNDSPPPQDSDTPPKQLPWGLIAAVVGFLVLGAFTYWALNANKVDREREAALEVIDKELSDDKAAMNAQKQLLADLSEQAEIMKNQIEMGHAKNGKAAVAEYKELAKRQREARDTYTQMIDAYNNKVAEYKKLQP